MGEVIAGRVELLESIASGATGHVWLGWDRRRRQECAVKVMKQSQSSDLLRFVREQGVKFEHPHLLSPYGWAAEDESVAILSPLCAGGTLSTALADHGAFSAPLVAEVVVQLLDGLRHVHAAGWVHRDVKPANVLLEVTGQAVPHLRLGDFGLAVHSTDPRLTMTGLVFGTPGYMAPELLDLADPSPAQDHWAVGALAVALLRPDLRGEELTAVCSRLGASVDATMNATTNATMDGAVEGTDGRLPSPVERTALGAVLRGLLAPDPATREATAAAAPHRLRSLRSDDGYLVASGEPFEVFDVVHGDAGPGGSERRSAGAGVADRPTDTVPVTERTAASAGAVAAPRGARGLLPLLVMIVGLVLLVGAVIAIVGGAAASPAREPDPDPSAVTASSAGLPADPHGG